MSLHHSWHSLLPAIHQLTLRGLGEGGGEEGARTGSVGGDFIALFY